MFLIFYITTPPRGSHAPGTFWYYNNWDFNALGAIFERLTGQKIGPAFYERIAVPTQMQDFRPEDVYYVAPRGDESIFPAYPFRITTRDMARFGYLFLRQGQWRGRQVIPASWVTGSTTSYSDTGRWGSGYGYLWWVAVNGDLVVAHAVEIDYPDRSNDLTQEELAKIPTFGEREMGKLLKMILGAKSHGKTNASDP
jgi:CubicO group peptidase (beta-lactamase class C family)